jgi:Ran-binding protein 3
MSDETHLFSSAITSAKPAEKEVANDENLQGNGDTKPDPAAAGEEEKESTESISNDNNLKLVEAARKYEEMRGAQKRKYEEVECTTGEEDERNILEINCKLFTFIENNYEERGRGMLRLNDSKTSSHSRVVFRASGSLRVLLNTKVWRDQICEQPSQKSLRLTAFDANGVIKIYLVMGRNEDISQLFRTLSSRIQKAKERSPEPEEPTATTEDDAEEPARKRAASE